MTHFFVCRDESIINFGPSNSKISYDILGFVYKTSNRAILKRVLDNFEKFLIMFALTNRPHNEKDHPMLTPDGSRSARHRR
jgi:hypothetical protein